MKFFLSVFTALAFALAMNAQVATAVQDSTYWRYAEISGIIGGFSSKMKVEVNYGENVTVWFRTPEMLNDPATGKAIKFNNMVDALNHLSVQGWELVQSYHKVDPSGLTAHICIIRRRESLQK